MDRKTNMNNWLQEQCLNAFFESSDINQHVPTLYFLANQCDHVTEFGVRWGVSSAAFLHSQAKVKSYDIEITGKARALFVKAQELGKDAELIEHDTLTIENFEPTDLLFLDTFHSYTQVIQELNLYHMHVKKWIVLHDTELFGETAQDGTQGINHAINEFLEQHGDWALTMTFPHNNGLKILSRK